MVPPPVAEEKEENRKTDCKVVEAHVEQIVISEKESEQTENLVSRSEWRLGIASGNRAQAVKSGNGVKCDAKGQQDLLRDNR